jgi:hypothetical protein
MSVISQSLIRFMQYSFQWGAPLNLAVATRLDWLFFAIYILQFICVAEVWIWETLNRFSRQRLLTLSSHK